MSWTTSSITHLLKQYSACDISDALLKLNVLHGGYIPDLAPLSPAAPGNTPPCRVARASTVLFVARDKDPPVKPAPNIPRDTHWADLTEPDTIVIIAQPDASGAANALCGGIMAARIKVRGAVGVVVVGRVRDLPELRETGLEIWSRGTSTVGAGAASRPYAVQVPVDIPTSPTSRITVSPGDFVVSDIANNGIVVIPESLVLDVIDLLPRIVAADEKVKEAVQSGSMTVYEAFEMYRKN